MRHFEVFNGDADGLCSLQQLRLARPHEHGPDARCVTGAKRDIALLARVDAVAGDSVTVLDVALEVNRPALLALLERGVRVDYFDHHHPGPIPRHALLDAHIDALARVCTGMLVDRFLGGTQRVWAAVAACGDNLVDEGRQLLATLGIDGARADALVELGVCLNYNAYGDSAADLIVAPAQLAELLRPWSDPFAFIAHEPAYRLIQSAHADDLAHTLALQPSHALACGTIMVLPDAPWARRMRGDLANRLANAAPALAHAVLTPNARGGYVVSVRAPLERGHGADRLCRQFESGSGRPAAAGINHLDASQIEAFAAAFATAFT